MRVMFRARCVGWAQALTAEDAGGARTHTAALARTQMTFCVRVLGLLVRLRTRRSMRFVITGRRSHTSDTGARVWCDTSCDTSRAKRRRTCVLCLARAYSTGRSRRPL